jgi:hypothetical protein
LGTRSGFPLSAFLISNFPSLELIAILTTMINRTRKDKAESRKQKAEI